MRCGHRDDFGRGIVFQFYHTQDCFGNYWNVVRTRTVRPICAITGEYGKMSGMERTWRDFKGVWIPKEIWLSPELSLVEKVLFVEIHSLDNERGCYATNRHFSDFFGLSERQIRRYLLTLKTKGLISVTILNDTDRVIHAVGKYARVKEPQLRELRQLSASLTEKLSLHRSRLSTGRPSAPDKSDHGGWTERSGGGGQKRP